MTTDMELLFGEKGPLAKNIANYAPRQQQIDLANAIDQSIEDGIPLIGEAPTGVGKSFAALVPAFKWIKKNDAPVVVVTSSIILQEQYYYKDVPFLEKLFNMNTGAVLLKGKSNYLCLHKGVEKKVSAYSSDQAEELLNIREWAKKTKTGDMSELDFTPSYAAWSEFAVVDEHECAGKDCPLFDNCFYYARRRQMKSAKLIICNYHYFFTALKSEKMLPPNIQVVIMDEGHEIPSIARDMEEESYNLYSYKRINQMLATAQRNLLAKDGKRVSISEDIELNTLLDSLTQVMVDVGKFFYTNRPEGKEKWILKHSEKAEMTRIGAAHLEALELSTQALEDYIVDFGLDQGYREAWDDYYTEAQIQWQFAMENYLSGLIERRRVARTIFDAQGQDQLPKDTIVWIEPMGENGVSIRVKPTNAAPIVGPIFSKNIGERPVSLQNATPIVISATLSVNGRFEHLKGDIGITSKVNELSVTSPFNLTDNLLWYLPQGVPDGNTPAHQMFAIDEMEKIIRVLKGRTLCLFTSFYSLQVARDHLRKVLPKEIDVIVQGEIPKQRIIDTLKDDPHVVVLGTKSFFTGVDIQGQNLSAVLIDKLPFPIAGEPVNEWLMLGDHGFWKHTLPETVISLKQGFGRLNRTTEDKGVVAVFDGRLATAGYKTHIFNSFDFKVTTTRDFGKVKEYLEGIINGIDQ